MSRFEVALYQGSVVDAPGETLLVPIPADERPLGGDAGRLDWRLGGEISEQLQSGFMTGQLGEAVLLPGRAPLAASRLLLLGTGPSSRLTGVVFQKTMEGAASRLRELHSRSVILALPARIDLEKVAMDLLRGLIRGMTTPSGNGPLCLVIPGAARRVAMLESAMASLLPEAHARGLALDVGWVGGAPLAN